MAASSSSASASVWGRTVLLCSALMAVAVLLVQPQACACDNQFTWWAVNSTNEVYGAGTRYADDVQAVLANLSTTAKAGGFVTVESENRTVFGLLNCMASASDESEAQQMCNDCTAAATEELRTGAPMAVGALVATDECFLRYDNNSAFLSHADSTILSQRFSSNSVSSDNATLSRLRNSLIDQAVAVHNSSSNNNESSSSSSASGVVNYQGYAYGSEGGVYGLVQCWGYIDAQSCRGCLHNITLHQNKYNPWHSTVAPSCYSSFDTYAFYEPDTGGAQAKLLSTSSITCLLLLPLLSLLSLLFP